MSAGISIPTTSEAETAALAERLARLLRPGDVILLSGPVGAGKSVFARAILRQLLNRPSEEVPSPTFTLVQRYQSAGMAIVHADLYRLKNSLELEETGLLDEPEDVILIVEWPELLPEWLTKRALAVTLSPEAANRTIRLASPDPGWNDRLRELNDAA